MNKSIEKFLEFNGKVIYFLGKEGQWWIAIKPICEALGVSFEKQRERLKNDPFWDQLPTIQGVVAADNRVRKMLCLPEAFIYGWLCSIQSSSPELIAYKRECYQLLFNHFNGSIGGRKHYLTAIAQAAIEREEVLARLEHNEDFKRNIQLDKIIKHANAGIKKVDKELLAEQLFLFREG